MKIRDDKTATDKLAKVFLAELNESFVAKKIAYAV
jgi:hypothetical protein